jgi:hypothetical protein
MNMAYTTQQAERTMTYAERRETDVALGELAAAFTKAGRLVKAALTGHVRDSRLEQTATAEVFREDVLVPTPGDEVVSAG